MKKLTKLVLIFIMSLWLVGCVVVVHNNIGSGITTHKKIGNQDLTEDFDTQLDLKKEEKKGWKK